MSKVIAGEAQSFTFDIMLEGDFAVPDVGSVTWSLRANDGSKLVSDEAVTTTEDQTQVSVSTTTSHNTKTGELEKRTIVLNYQINGHWYQQTKTYWVHDWLNYATEVQHVRDWMGVTRAELPDEELDLDRVYYQVKSELGESGSKFEEALGSATHRQYDAEMAIIYRAVIEVGPSLQYRVAAKEQDDQLSWSRMNKMDFNALVNQARQEYTRVLRSIRSADEEVGPTLFAVSNPPDPVTGDAL